MVTTIDLCFQNQSQAIAAYLIKTNDGPVLIETGPHSTLPVLEAALLKSGFKLSDIKHAFVTHIHLDHAGAAWALAEQGATIYVHPLGLPHLHNPDKLLSSAKRIYQDKMDSLWGTLEPIPKEQLCAVRHGSMVKIGGLNFSVWHTPGHAIHHITIAVKNLAFTGDVAGVKVGENGPVMPPCPPPDIDIETWRASINLLKLRRFNALYLTHFGRVNNPKKHFLELEGRLLNWANWIRPFWERNAPFEEVLPLFKAYVDKSYDQLGLPAEDRLRYDLANPPDMSIGGLYRYWTKKAAPPK
ncbi:MAG: MBL fold metallo-hydrolase [Saprospiraceae bacterium]|nr:MBL fold metallo-hydrolase [Saprospiraceae bacterium]